jgi:hypothetical protein
MALTTDYSDLDGAIATEGISNGYSTGYETGRLDFERKIAHWDALSSW